MINSQQVLGKLIVHTQLVTQSQIKGKMNEWYVAFISTLTKTATAGIAYTVHYAPIYPDSFVTVIIMHIQSNHLYYYEVCVIQTYTTNQRLYEAYAVTVFLTVYVNSVIFKGRFLSETFQFPSTSSDKKTENSVGLD